MSFCQLIAIFAVVSSAGSAPAAAKSPVCVAVIADSDLHGAIAPHLRRAEESELRYGGLLAQSAYVEILRRRYGDRLLLVSAGDIYQGTLVSNLSQGRAVIDAYNQLGYAASAVGNHDFDYGARPEASGDSNDLDRLGILKDRIAQATFVFLTTNIFEKATHQRVAWPGSAQSVIVDAGGVRVGIIGVATVETPKVTRPINVATLEFTDPVPLVIAEARRLRSVGAEMIIVTTHLGAKCRKLDNPHDRSSCAPGSELFAFLETLPAGTVDIAIGGHSHSFAGHIVNGTMAIQAGARGRALGWADVCLAPSGGIDTAASKIHPPIHLCLEEWDDDEGGCGSRRRTTKIRSATFLDTKVAPTPAMVETLAPYLAAAQAAVDAPINVHLATPLVRDRGKVWLGVLVAEGMQRAAKTDFGVQNLGGVRTDLPAGEISYGQAYEVLPFGNQIAVLRLTGEQVRAFVQQLISRRGGPPYMAGLRAVAAGGGYRIERADGTALGATTFYTLATSDFLEGGGEGLEPILAGIAPADRKVIDATLRGALIELLAKRFPSAGRQ